MVAITSAEDLRRAFPQGFRADRLEAELAKKGMVLAPAIANRLRAARARIAEGADAARRASWKAAAQKLGPVIIGVAPPATVIARREPGDYDMIAAVDLSAISDVLAGLHESRIIPHVLDLQRLLSPSDLHDITKEFQGGFTSVPQGDNTTVLRLNIEGAGAVGVVPDTDRIRVGFPFSVDISGGTPPEVVKLQGVLSFEIALTAHVNLDKINLSVSAADELADDGLTIVVSPDSAVQPISASFLQSLETLLEGILVQDFKPNLISQTLSAFISIPSFSNAQVLVTQIDVRAQARGEGGVVVVGVIIGGPDTDRGDPARLTEPFGTHGGNLYLRVHQEFVEEALQKALNSGELEQQAREQNDAVRIHSADAVFSPLAIQIVLKGSLQDACGFDVDAPFVSTMSFQFSFTPDRIIIQRSQSVGLDTSDADTYLCITASILEGALIGALTAVFLGSAVMGVLTGVLDFYERIPGNQIIEVVRNALYGGSGGGGLPDLVVSLTDPIPGTERLPQIGVSDLQIDSTAQQGWYTISLVPDNLNTHVYVRFLQTTRSFPRSTLPVSGKTVRMFDQDTPRPDGDDSPQTDETDQVIFQNNKLMVTETVQFIPPFGDEALGSATTGFEGIAHFVISQLASIAGTVVTTQTTDYLRTGDEKTTSTSTPAFEARPDLYFLMTNDETQVDTRRVSPGLLVNAGAGGRVGTADNPITFTFSPNIVAQP